MYTHLELLISYRDNYDDHNTHFNCTNLSRIQVVIKWTINNKIYGIKSANWLVYR